MKQFKVIQLINASEFLLNVGKDTLTRRSISNDVY